MAPPDADVGARAGAAGASLDLRTKLPPGDRYGLVLSVIEGAGEAVLYEPRPPKAPKLLRDLGQLDGATDLLPYPAHWTDEDVEAELERRHEKNQERATRRAVVASRRFIVANKLRYMWVLTRLGGEGLHGAAGRARLMVLVADFITDLRTELGIDFPYWYSPELHPAGKNGGSRETCPIPDECGCGGHGWHANVFVARRIEHALMKRLWTAGDPGNGYELRVKDWTRDDRLSGLPFYEKLRAGARYGTKYATKDWSELVLEDGAHRYEVAQGFTPSKRSYSVADRDEAEAVLASIARTQLAPDWCSIGVEDWDGPPCWIYTFTPRPSLGASPP